MTKTSNKQRQWERRLKDQVQSGLGEREYCRARKLAHHTFRYWRKKLGSAAKLPRRAAQFSRVEVDAPAPSPMWRPTVLRLGGSLRMECEGWPDPRWLAELSLVMGEAR